MRWEYKYVEPAEEYLGPELRLKLFNELGAEGWELISPPGFSSWFFKRSVELLYTVSVHGIKEKPRQE